MKIRLVMLGKTRRSELRALLDDYLGRIRRHAEIEAVELRDSSAALRKFQFDAAATPATMVVLLDAAGKQFTSEQFARWLAGHRDAGTRELIFLCGRAGGLPQTLRRRANTKLSLSTLTLSHELARVLLAEQIYRGFASRTDRKSTRLNSSHVRISYAVFCLKKKKQKYTTIENCQGMHMQHG